MFRRTADAIRQDVEAAVAGIYNRAIQLAAGVEYMFFVEDDVIPKRPDAVDQLLRLMNGDTVAASGLYRHRYDPVAVAFGFPADGRIPMRPMNGPTIEQVAGTGFGCLLIRKSVLNRFGLSGDDTSQPHYDVDLAARIAATSAGRWLLHRGVPCDHLIGVG